MAMHNDSALKLARNLQQLMDDRNLSQAQLARKSGVAQRTISTLLNTSEPEAINPRTATLHRLATYFGIELWQLLMPDLPIEVLKSPRFSKLVENYTAAPDEGRRAVERIAEGEVRYSVAEKMLHKPQKAG